MHVSDNPEDFVKVAVGAHKILGGDLGFCAHGFDQSYWDLSSQNGTVTVHREHYSGVSIFADATDHASVELLRRYALATDFDSDSAWADQPLDPSPSP